MAVLAITGGTGFVGGHLLRMARANGHEVRALTRREQPAQAGVAWVKGALDRPESLAELVAGADAVIHVAGVINAPDRAGFAQGNITGTETLLAAVKAAGVRRFIHVSSLSAREPDLSAYGWSKLVSEQRVRLAAAAGGLDFTIVRPPAVYGPGDRETLEFFRMARHGFVLLPPGGRLSVIAAEDLCRLLIDLPNRPETIHQTYEPDDGIEGGWSHTDFARAIGAAVGRPVRPIAVPMAVMRAAAFLDGLFRRAGAKLTPDRVRMYSHPDWVAGPHARPAPEIWQPRIDTRAGLVDAAAWYRAAGWLK
ncbi:NAD-dependent epimerase/dehydratase family protein [Sphingomonas naphthae]|uniref:NAD-dependent epimerase/dehydratase family protein n=1 Tax=Sphingomonas naphthae TaxID=1813468 RepID=A0ABY7TIN4_9SPHN|nr:NAD-dependent epimerase/dehydratase family protein [Sphingomonas naphthae]WCT72773.1 NAD-dependent epimerase/dehydratase family protein [Sphingomonas naphthae]